MILWILTFLCIFELIKVLWRVAPRRLFRYGLGKQRQELKKVALFFQEMEETLMAGLVPDSAAWRRIRDLPSPWGKLSSDSLLELRASGGALTPTLKRLRRLAEEQETTLMGAQAKSSQAFAQAFACAALVPLLGLGLYFFLPGIAQNSFTWVGLCIAALLLAGSGALWLLHLAEKARWGGLAPDHHHWILGSQCAGERFLAMVRCGTPPDLAWARAHELLRNDQLDLAIAWGHSVWEAPHVSFHGQAEQLITAAGISIRKAVQVSLMEGRPCTERVEAALESLREGLKAQVERELSLLATRALKPLFVCVAPALLGLLTAGLYLVAQETLGASDHVF